MGEGAAGARCDVSSRTENLGTSPIGDLLGHSPGPGEVICPDCNSRFLSRVEPACAVEGRYICARCTMLRNEAAGHAPLRRTWKEAVEDAKRRDAYAGFDEEAFERDRLHREPAALAGKPPPEDRMKGYDDMYDDEWIRHLTAEALGEGK